MTIPCRRFAENPLLVPEQVKPSRPDARVLGAFNAGAFEYKGRFGLLVRVAEVAVQDDPAVRKILQLEFVRGRPRIGVLAFRRDDPELDLSRPGGIVYRDGVRKGWLGHFSHLRLAWSDDGRRWRLDPKPSVLPADRYETGGMEDPRVTLLEGRYLITYTGVGRLGITDNLLSTRDWKRFARHGPLFVPDNKDVCIFPAKVGGRYVALHRPSSSGHGMPNLWIAFSPDLVHWGGHECLMEVRPGMWDSARIGCGPPPLRTKKGWLEIYHGSDNRGYCLGAVLLDLKNPRRVLARSREPILVPEAPYEKQGYVPNVVFSCGEIVRPDGTLWIYYGGADRVIAGCETSIDEILRSLEAG